MRIILFSPSTTVINGGIKQIFSLGDTLCDLGFDAVVFEEQGRRPMWFKSHVPIVGQGSFVQNPDEVFVLPEDQPQILKMFKDWPQRKVLYSQNHFYASLSLQDVECFSDYGITHALCCSYTTLKHMEWRHPKVEATLLPCGVDATRFQPAKKQRKICYMPRKRPLECLYLKDIFKHTYPEHKAWEWKEINDMTEQQTAKMMGEAGVFLSMGRLESLGLTPLEAMASGCVLAGFTGIGGREFANSKNGFWAEEDDFEEAVEQIHQAIKLAEMPMDAPERLAYHAATQEALKPYTPEAFKESAAAAFKKIIS